jgi:hypothetical protein
MGNSGYRTTSRRVTYQVALTGEPIIYQYAEDAHRILVESVRLDFDHDDDGCSVSAHLQGPYLLRNGKPGKARADDFAGSVFETWPTWLQALADEHLPERYREHRGPLQAGARDTATQTFSEPTTVYVPGAGAHSVVSGDTIQITTQPPIIS